MAGSIFGTIFKISTWGESHGAGVGVVVDGCPAGLSLCEEDIMKYLNRRKPGQTRYATPRKEDDEIRILSGVFEGKTTGAPVSMMVENKTQRSKDYGDLAHCYRPGHADYTFDQKYGIRDYRGGGRSSGRETIARVAAGAVAAKLLAEMGIEVYAYAESIGGIRVDPARFNRSFRDISPLQMPDEAATEAASALLEQKMKEHDSVGGTIGCIVTGLPAGLGDPVFEKLDANLGKAIFSIGAVKGVEIGDGFRVAEACGSENNDEFLIQEEDTAAEEFLKSNGENRKGTAEENSASVDSSDKICGFETEKNEFARKKVVKATNHAGGILGGMSDGSKLFLRAAVKPTPSIFREQRTVTDTGEEKILVIHGRHDPVIVPRAVVVVEAMTAIVILDALLLNMTAKAENVIRFYRH
ncbi:MAG: chorismate synthase [Lachnospiraceae bacterium]|nr:chorismate synthase [Lachnospiraceae bacterium]